MGISASLIGCMTHVQPSLLVDSQHTLVGYIDHTHKALWISSLRKGRYCQKRWLEAFGLKHIHKLPDNKMFILPNGKTISIEMGSSLGTIADFTLMKKGDSSLPSSLAIENLRPLTSYAVFGAGEEVRSSYENRPWHPLPLPHSLSEPETPQ